MSFSGGIAAMYLGAFLGIGAILVLEGKSPYQLLGMDDDVVNIETNLKDSAPVPYRHSPDYLCRSNKALPEMVKPKTISANERQKFDIKNMEAFAIAGNSALCRIDGVLVAAFGSTTRLETTNEQRLILVAQDGTAEEVSQETARWVDGSPFFKAQATHP